MLKFKKVLCLLMTLIMAFSAFSMLASAQQETPFENSLFYKTGDYDIHYRIIPAKGEEKGRILFLHGFLLSSSSWVELASLLSEDGYMCLLADLPGFGYSTREAPEIEPINREEIMASLMNHVGPGEKWIVAGHSMGGSVASGLANNHTSQIEALMLFAPAGNMVGFSGGFMEKLSLPLGKMMNLFFKAITIIAKFDWITSALFSVLGYPDGYDTSLIFEPLKIENTGLSMIYMMQRVSAVDFSAMQTLEIPIFLLWAEADEVLLFSSSAIEEIERSMPEHAQVATLAGAGHMMIETRTDDVYALSREFLLTLK